MNLLEQFLTEFNLLHEAIKKDLTDMIQHQDLSLKVMSLLDNKDLSTYIVKELLKLDDKDSSYIIGDRYYPLHQGEEKMSELDNLRCYSRLVILITPRGHIKTPENIFGIITLADIPRVLEYLR